MTTPDYRAALGTALNAFVAIQQRANEDDIESLGAIHIMAGAAIARARTLLAAPEVVGVTDEELLGLDELEALWNAQADRFNEWTELGIDEIVAFAQQQALSRFGTACRRTLEQAGEGVE